MVLSDLFGDLATIVGGLDHLRYNNHEVIIFHIMDPWERDLSVDGQIRFRDLESGETLTTQAEGIREAYRKAVDDWRQALELECRKRAIDRIELTTKTRPTGRSSTIWSNGPPFKSKELTVAFLRLVDHLPRPGDAGGPDTRLRRCRAAA